MPVTDLPEEVWDHFLAINTTAVFLCTKMVGREMVRMGRGGRIINIASDAAKRANALGAAYSASKFAVLGLTQASALDPCPLWDKCKRSVSGADQHRQAQLLGEGQSGRSGGLPRRVQGDDSGRVWQSDSTGPHRRAGRHSRYDRLSVLRPSPLHHRSGVQRKRGATVPLRHPSSPAPLILGGGQGRGVCLT